MCNIEKELRDTSGTLLLIKEVLLVGICMWWIWLLSPLLLAFVTPAWSTVLADQPYSIDSAGRLVTTVTIDGQGPFTFLIDTACSHTMIYDHARAQLGLTTSDTDRIAVYAINKVSLAVPLKVDRIGIGNENISDMTLGVLPDRADLTDEPDGILGVDILSYYLVVLDRRHMRLRLETPDSDTSAYNHWTRLALVPHLAKNVTTPFWYMRTRINHSDFVTLFDLGASVNMLNWNAAEKLGLHQNKYKKLGRPPDALRDALGTDSPTVRLKGLTINARDEAWGGQFAFVTDSPLFDRFNLDTQAAAIVGPGLLRDNSLVIDFASDELYIGPP